MPPDPSERPATALTAEALFCEALERPAEERLSYLADTCPGRLVRAEVEALLAAHERAEGGRLLDTRELGAVGAGAAREVAEQLARDRDEEPGATEQPGKWIGRYRLLERLGEGGFGVVWMAEQREPVRRRVALKVIKLGMDTRR